jgi:hypothetical protein
VTNFLNIPDRHRQALINVPAIILDVRELGLTLADVFAPNVLRASQFSDVMPRTKGATPLVRVVAVDGNCWASVTGVTEVGGLIIEPDVAPSATPRRKPSRVADAA